MASTIEIENDFQFFQQRPVIRDFKLSAELFASCGDRVLVCGKSNLEKQGFLLVSYEIPSAALTAGSDIRLLKVVKLTQKSVQQLETIPILKIVLVLGDGHLTLLDLDTLAEISTISHDVSLFATR